MGKETEEEVNPNTTGEDNNDDSISAADSILNSVNNPSVGTPKPNRSGASKALSKFSGNSGPSLSNEYINSSGETGNLGFQTYFPGELNNIQKGYYSGSIVGSNPITASSALYPMGMVDARKLALARAADQKVANDSAWTDKFMALTKPNISKRDSVNPDIIKNYNAKLGEYVSKFKSDHPDLSEGQAYKAMMQDPELNNHILPTQAMAEQLENHGVEKVAALHKESETPNRTVFSGDLADAQNFTNGTFAKNIMGFDKDSQETALRGHGRLNESRGYTNPTHAISELSKVIKPDDAKYFSGIAPEEGFKRVMTTTDQHTPEGRAKTAAMDSYNSEGYADAYKRGQIQEKETGIPSNVPSPEQYLQGFMSLLGKKKETTQQIVKDEQNKDDINFDANNLTTAGKVITAQSKGNALTHAATKDEAINGIKEGDLIPTMKQKIGLNGAPMFDASGDKNPIMEPAFEEPKTYNFSTGAGGLTLTKPLKVSLGEGAHWTNLGDSKGGNFDVQKTGGVKDVTVGDIHPFPVYAGTNKVIPQKRADELIKDHPEQVEYRQFGVSKFNENGSNGKPEEKSALIPFDELENSINEKDRSKKMVSTMKAAAQAETEKIHQGSVYEYNGHSAPKKEWLKNGWTPEQLEKHAKKK